MRISTNVLIVGGGIIGIAIARSLCAKGFTDILIIEKEKSVAQHASGRNSGVLHAGIYYPTDSLKAKFCLQGNLMMQQYCQENGLKIDRCGKAIVTRTEQELDTLQLLYDRARANGAHVELIDEQQLLEVEPCAKTTVKALYSHNTAVVDPKQIMGTLYKDLNKAKSCAFEFDTKFLKLKSSTEAVTNKGIINFKILINAAGAYADKIAHLYNLVPYMSLIPFKGIYKRLVPNERCFVKGNIYPVPNIKNPFLGIHFTKSVDGTVYVGPTAIPVLGPENYSTYQDLKIGGFSVFAKDMKLFFSNSKFRRVAYDELSKYFPHLFFETAAKLVKNLEPGFLKSSNKVGIRPQLVDWRTKELVMDYVIEKTENSVHILNSISPAFTSSFAFADYVVENYIEELL